MPAVFAVKKAIGPNVQLCQAEDITPSGMTMKRPRGTFIVPRTEVDLAFALPGSQEEISARGVVVNDVVVGSFRRTGRALHRGPPRARAADRRLLPPALVPSGRGVPRMPELPEVEVAARNLRRWALGRKVRAVRADRRAARILAARARRGRSGRWRARGFEAVRRRGKNLLLTLAKPKAGRSGVWSHLGMTGKWLHRRAGEPAPRFARVRIDLDDGDQPALRGSPPVRPLSPRARGALRVAARTSRRSAPIRWTTASTSTGCRTRLARTRLPIKVAILDQTLLPGIGNIQASEGLFRAGIDPRRPARSLSRAELARLARGLLDSIRYTLKTFKHSGADGADADIDYVEERKIPNPFLVYGRAGETVPAAVRGKTGKTAVTAGVQRAGDCPHRASAARRRSSARRLPERPVLIRASRLTPSIATSPSEQHPPRRQVLSRGAGAHQARHAPARDQVALQTQAGQVLAAHEVQVLRSRSRAGGR